MGPVSLIRRQCVREGREKVCACHQVLRSGWLGVAVLVAEGSLGRTRTEEGIDQVAACQSESARAVAAFNFVDSRDQQA